MLDFSILKSYIIKHIRDFFYKNHYIEVWTSLANPYTTNEVFLDSLKVSGNNLEKQYFLITSPEYEMKTMLVNKKLKNIFQITKCFRDERRTNISNHEFLMLEWYRKQANYLDIIKETEELCIFLFNKYLNRQLDIERITVNEIFKKIANTHKNISHKTLLEYMRDNPIYHISSTNYEDLFDMFIATEVENFIKKKQAVFLMDYPKEFASNAKLKDENFCERFELYIQGIEICNGFTELIDYEEQRQRIEKSIEERRKKNKQEYPIPERFLNALKKGIGNCAGNAIGLDRLIMILSGKDSIFY